MTLSASQEDEFCSRPFVNLGDEFPFPEEPLPKQSRVETKVPFMTLVSCICEWLRSDGDFSLVERLRGLFLASLGGREPEFTSKRSH